MTFKLFIYYSAVMGGWGAFLAWCLVRLFGIESIESPTVRVMVIGALLGMFVAAYSLSRPPSETPSVRRSPERAFNVAADCARSTG